MWLLAGRSRFQWPAEGAGGFNCADGFTFSDITGAFFWILTYPGDFILNDSDIASFFELQLPVVGHPASYVIGILLALMVFGAIADKLG